MTHEELVDAVFDKQISLTNCLTDCDGIDCKECSENLVKKYEEEIRIDAIRKFIEWLDKSEKYSLSKVIRCWEDNRYDQHLKVDINEVLSEYEKMKEGTEND